MAGVAGMTSLSFVILFNILFLSKPICKSIKV